jgi:hypothetical protein
MEGNLKKNGEKVWFVFNFNQQHSSAWLLLGNLTNTTPNCIGTLKKKNQINLNWF